jgi:hypothetical protein
MMLCLQVSLYIDLESYPHYFVDNLKPFTVFLMGGLNFFKGVL